MSRTAPRQVPVRSSDTVSPWKELIRDRFRAERGPGVYFSSVHIPTPELIAGVATWTNKFERCGLCNGDRILLATEPSPTFLFALFAAFSSGLTVAIARPQDASAALAAELCVRGVITGHDFHPSSSQDAQPTPGVRLLLKSSGTVDEARWVALSDQNIFSVIESHGPKLALENATVLSVLPWHHAFGLVIDLLPALLAGATVIRDPSHGKDPALAISLAQKHAVTHLSMVPLQARRLGETPGGANVIRALAAGVIGGAPITNDLVPLLQTTRLRVGYGLTEASPGVCLGRPGRFFPRSIGEPLNCHVRINPQGTLEFRGPNACAGLWRHGAFTPLPEGRWVDTGDLVKPTPHGLVFVGRAGFDFKLSNGTWVNAAEVEQQLEQHFVAVESAMLASRDGVHLQLFLSTRGNAPPLAQIRDALGPLGAKLNQVVERPAGATPRTPKGTLDRRRASEVLRQTVAVA